MGGDFLKTKVLLFGDPGIDDSFAIIYALLNPNIELVGIVTGYGNVTKDQATANAYYLLQLAGRTDVPIIPGASNPVEEDDVVYYPEIHGSNGIGPIQPPSGLQFEVHPFEMIRTLINRYPNEVVIVDIGRSTSLATAFILFNDEIKKVKSFYIMGGAFFVPGNATPLAEANFYGDPPSSSYILEKAHNLTLAPLNVTQYAIITEEIVETLRQYSKSPFSFLLSPIFEYYFDFYKKKSPKLEGAPIHDLLALMLVTAPSIAEFIFYDAKVIDGLGEAQGMSYIDIRPGSSTGKTRIAVKLNYEKFVEEFYKVMLNG